MKPKTYTAGANAERTAIIAKVKRTRNKCEAGSNPRLILDNLLDWLSERDSRYNKKKGGVGK